MAKERTMTKVRTFKNKKGNIKLKVTKDDSGKKVISVKDALGNIKVEHGKIKDLKLADETAKTRTCLTNIPDNMVLETHGSPQCFWYFFNGKYYRICI